MSEATKESITEADNATKAVSEEISEKVTTEEFKVNGEAIVTKVKEIIREGNIRRIIIKNDEDKTLLEIPLTVGVVGGLLLPAPAALLAALGTIGALIANLSITVERVEKKEVIETKDADPALEAAS